VLQQASAATRQWNEFLKGLVAGYNSCAITNQQYADSLKRIYPRLKEDAAAGLEEIRKVVSEGRNADEKRLKSLLDSYCQVCASLPGRAEMTSLLSIAAVVDKGTDRVLERLDALELSLKQAPIATPAQVKKEVSAINEKLLAKADEAQAAY
jgi:hypothetical protein